MKFFILIASLVTFAAAGYIPAYSPHYHHSHHSHHVPYFEHPPVIKYVVPPPVYKVIPAATSYSSIHQVHSPPVYKPIIKYVSAPILPIIKYVAPAHHPYHHHW